MSTFIMTNVRLPAEMLKALKLRAVEEGKSVAELVRESIYRYLEEPTPKITNYDDDPFFRLGASGWSGLGDGAAQHDRYLYGRQEGPL
jgi:hypothetical protein